MGLVKSTNLVLYRVVFLWTVSFFLLKDPVDVYANILVVVLGQSMHLPNVYEQAGTNVVGLLAGVLALLGLEDFLSLFSVDPLARLRGVVPIRLFGYFILTTCAYFRLAGLGNAVAFTYGFLETMLNFWLYTAVREELNEQTRQSIRKERGHAGDAGLNVD